MQNRTFRLFVSSTFSDFTQERSLLQTIVFPEIKKYCSSNKLTFQPIDLRWGVSSEAQLDQKTLELCLNEVKSSKLNPHPNFLIMAGDRYGWIPLPYLIEEKEFNTILEYVENIDDKKLLNSWYKLDENQLPASYILNERKDEYAKYSSWEEVEINLINILQIAVNKSNLTNEQKNRYFTSATEAEVIEGIFKYLNKTPFQNKLLEKDNTLENKDYENVYAYIRNIKSIDNLNDKFIDKEPTKVNNFKNEIKKSIDNKNILESNVNLINVSKDEKNGSLVYSYDEIKDKEDSIFVKTMINNLKKSIDTFVSQIKDISNDEIEKYEQIRFKDSKLKDFLPNSRVDALENIEDYISSNENQTLVVYGKSGLGKSSLMAKAIQNAEDKYNTLKKVIYRFVGSTANLSDTPTLLISILKDLNIQEEIKTISNPQTMQEEAEKIEEFYYRCYSHLSSLKDETIIFIDAIDQINNEDEFLWLPQTLPDNLKIIISALEDEKYPEDSIYFETLKTKTENLYPLEAFENPKELINSLLSQYNRTITEKQMEYLLSKEDSNSPLYLSIATQELIHWKSSDDSQNLASTQKEIIKEFTQNLTTLFHHDKEFVKRVFTYLYLSKGLSESELLEIISTDEEFISKIAPETYHNNDTKELPIVIWARLHTQIKEFLKLENQDNAETMSFFHREFNDSIKTQEDIKEIHEHLILLLQKLIIQYQNEPFESNRWGNLYIEIIKDYHLEYEFDYLLIENSLFYNSIDIMVKNVAYSYYIEFEFMENELSLYRKGKIKESIFYAKLNIQITKSLYEVQKMIYDGDYIESYLKYAHILKNIEKVEEAIKYIDKAYFLLKKREEYSDIANLINSLSTRKDKWDSYLPVILNNLSAYYAELKNYNKALEYCLEVENIVEKNFENNSRSSLNSYVAFLNNLGSIYSGLSRFDESIKCHLKASDIIDKYYYELDEEELNGYISIQINLMSTMLLEEEELKENIITVVEIILLAHIASKRLFMMNEEVWLFRFIDNNILLFNCLELLNYERLRTLNIKVKNEVIDEKYLSSLLDLQISLLDKIIDKNQFSYFSKLITTYGFKLYFHKNEKDITNFKNILEKNYAKSNINYIDYCDGLLIMLKFYWKINKSESISLIDIINRIYEEHNLIEKNHHKVINYYDFILSIIVPKEEPNEYIKYAQELINILDKYNIKYEDSHIILFNNLVVCFKQLGNYEKALEYNIKFVSLVKEKELIYKDNNLFTMYSMALNNISNHLLDLCFNDSISIENKKYFLKNLLIYAEEFYIISKKKFIEDKDKYLPFLISINCLAKSCKLNQNKENELTLFYEYIDVVSECNLNKDDNYEFALANIYYLNKSINRNNLNDVIDVSFLKIIKELYNLNPQRWAENYTTSLNDLAISFYNIEEYSKAIELETEALEITKELYKEYPQKWAGDYTTSLNYLASSYLNIKDFKNSSYYFQEYFEIFDIDFIDNIDELPWLVYPFVKYYQAKLILNENVSSLDKYINEKIKYLKNKFENDYEIQINEIYEVYKKLANNSEKEFDKQKLEIFEKIFIKEN